MRGPDADRSREAFETWRADPVNARAYAEVEVIWSLAGNARVEAAPHGRSAKRAWARPMLAAAAVATLLAAGAHLVLRERPSGIEPVVYAGTPIGEREVVLADGSRVILGRGSRIAAEFAGAERIVRLTSGEARFEVAHDAARPFVVVAQDRSIVARGTVFNVALTAEGVSVTLVEGIVDLETRVDRRAPRHIARLLPGEKASFVRGDDKPKIAVAPGADQHGPDMLTGDDLTVAEVIAGANLRSASRIQLADPSLGTLRVSGGFPLRRPKDLASTLGAALELKVIDRADGVIVLERTGRTPPSE